MRKFKIGDVILFDIKKHPTYYNFPGITVMYKDELKQQLATILEINKDSITVQYLTSKNKVEYKKNFIYSYFQKVAYMTKLLKILTYL